MFKKSKIPITMTEKGGFWRRVSRWINPESEIPGTQGKVYKVTTKGVSPYPPNYQEPSSAQTSRTPTRPTRYPLIEQELGEKYRRIREEELVRQREEAILRREAEESAEKKRLAQEATLERERNETLSQMERVGLLDMISYAAQLVADKENAYFIPSPEISEYSPFGRVKKRTGPYVFGIKYAFRKGGRGYSCSASVSMATNSVGLYMDPGKYVFYEHGKPDLYEYPEDYLYRWEDDNEEKLQGVIADTFKNIEWGDWYENRESESIHGPRSDP